MKELSLPKNWTHTHHESVPSTMLLCNPAALSPGHFHIVSADEQTAGRGQRGTIWESAKGMNLTFNIEWKSPEGPWPVANEQFLISEITAIAVLRTIDNILAAPAVSQAKGATTSSLLGVSEAKPYFSPRAFSELSKREHLRDATIKWPNDIYVGDHKICGMLLEHIIVGKRIESSIAGIGININQETFISNAPNPISLRQILGHNVSREKILEDFAYHFMDGIRLLRQGDYEEIENIFTARLYRRTGFHHYRDADGLFLGEFIGIARNGIITFRKQDGTLRDYAFKEVSYVI